MRTNVMIALSNLSEASDPFTAIASRDWASLGGWTLFLGLVIFIVYGSFRETWVPGARYRRLEAAYKEQSEAMALLISQNGKLIDSGKLSDYFFKEVLPNKTGASP